MPAGTRLAGLWRGVLLSAGVAGLAIIADRAEARVIGRDWLESLVLAILLGTVLRSAWTPDQRFRDGIRFSAKTLLEIAVMLLGASISTATLLAVGPRLLLGVFAVVGMALLGSYALARMLGLGRRLAVLVSCGNSICGNSAIAAVAPVIGATGDEIAASIAFTAVLGIVVVIGLPFFAASIGMKPFGSGILAGLTVYAVPQVLAATVPMGAAATQIGTLVKLVRVLALGPIVLVLSVFSLRRAEGASWALRDVFRFVPWFIVGFLALMGLRSAGLLPSAILPPLAALTSMLTIVAMAALGLSTDVRVVARAGLRVSLAVILSLTLLGAISLGLIRTLGAT